MDVSEDIVTKNFSGMNIDEVLEYLIQEVKARNYLITRINNIDNIHDRLNGDAANKVRFKFYLFCRISVKTVMYIINIVYPSNKIVSGFDFLN